MTVAKGKPAFRAGRDSAALAENMELLTGQRGDQLDRAITRRELAAMGLTNLRKVGNAYVPDGIPPGLGGNDQAVTVPTVPRNVTADGAFHTILIEWDRPAYQGHAHAEIWRASENTLSKAALVGTTAATLFSDAIGKDAHAFYWVRFVNRNDVEGPWQGVDGVEASTSADIQDILDKLQGEIKESHLAGELLGPIKQVPQLSDEVELGAVTLVEAALANDERDQANRLARGRIVVLQQALADAHESLARLVVQLTADFETETDALRGQVTLEAKARADEDEALGELIETVTAKAGELSSAVQTHSQAIASLNGGAQAMWSVKAQAGDIKAGIGLIAKSDGTSQVMVSASQFFVFDPNSAAPTAPLFAIDQGKVVIAEALIRNATIQIIHAEKITADTIKAGASISAPVITGGKITIGNNFLVNENGEMTAWSATLRYLTSYYGTFNNANINFATMRNCVIEEDCEIRGTVYADRIIGDVVATRLMNLPDILGAEVSALVLAQSKPRIVLFGGIVINAQGYTQSGGGDHDDTDKTRTTLVELYLNGVLIKTFTTSATGRGSSSTRTLSYAYQLPANQQGLFVLKVASRGVASIEAVQGDGGNVAVFRTSTGTFG